MKPIVLAVCLVTLLLGCASDVSDRDAVDLDAAAQRPGSTLSPRLGAVPGLQSAT
jgi:hypothetical protein